MSCSSFLQSSLAVLALNHRCFCLWLMGYILPDGREQRTSPPALGVIFGGPQAQFHHLEYYWS